MDSTDALPNSGRAAFDAEQWRQVVETQFGGVRTVSVSADDLPTGCLVGSQLGEVGAFEMSGPPQVFQRSESSIKRYQIDLLKVCVQLTGRTTLHQDGREVMLAPGQLAIYDTARPYEMRLDGAWSCGVLTLPRTSLNLPWKAITRAMDHAFSVNGGAGAVLANLMSTVTSERSIPHDTAAVRMGDAGVQLLAGTLVQDGSIMSVDPADEVRTRVMTFIRHRLSDPELTHSSVAAEHHISTRTLDRLFSDQPFTVVGYIRHLRLEAVRRDLQDPSATHSTISEIASRWGFHDPAHFARLFRDTYGLSASEVKANAQGIAP